MHRPHRLMNVIKLKYESKEIGIADLLEKGIILSEEMGNTANTFNS